MTFDQKVLKYFYVNFFWSFSKILPVWKTKTFIVLNKTKFYTDVFLRHNSPNGFKKFWKATLPDKYEPQEQNDNIHM